VRRIGEVGIGVARIGVMVFGVLGIGAVGIGVARFGDVRIGVAGIRVVRIGVLRIGEVGIGVVGIGVRIVENGGGRVGMAWVVMIGVTQNVKIDEGCAKIGAIVKRKIQKKPMKRLYW
jgi:hypothetical protein